MAAHGPAGVGTVTVIMRFRRPYVDHLVGCGAAAGNIKKILAEDGVRAMIELALAEQMAGPILGARG